MDNKPRPLHPLFKGLDKVVDRKALTPASLAAADVQARLVKVDEQLQRACSGPPAPDLVQLALNQATAELNEAAKAAKETSAEITHAKLLVELAQGILEERQSKARNG